MDAEVGFPELVDRYAEALAARRRSEGLVHRSAYVLSMLVTFLADRGIRDVRRVKEAHLVSFAAALEASCSRRGGPYALQTRALYLTVVRRFFAYLSRHGVLLVDPARELRTPRVSSLPRLVLNVAEAERLVGAAPELRHRMSHCDAVEQRNRALVEVLYGTGIRRRECLMLDLADVDLAERTLLVRNGKGLRDRYVPLPGRAAAALEDYLRLARPVLLDGRSSPAVFVAWRRGRLSEPALAVMLRQRGRAAELPASVSPHVLRHTCATHLLQGGADVRHVQELLGHRAIGTTARYTRVVVTDLRRMIDWAHPRRLWPV